MRSRTRTIPPVPKNRKRPMNEPEIDEPEVVYPPNPTSTTAKFLVVLPCGHVDWIDREQWRGDVSIDCTVGAQCGYHDTVDLRGQTPGAKQKPSNNRDRL